MPTIISQCNDQVRLSSQAEVDAFRIKYGNCKKLLWLVLDGSESPIYNLDSLYALEEIPFLQLRYLDSLRPDASFKNLKVVQELSNNSNSRNIIFPNLDTVQVLYHTFPDSSQDLSIYKNVKFIKSKISLLGKGNLKGLGKFTTSPDFSIGVSVNQNSNTLENLIPESLVNLMHLSISNTSNLSLKGCDKIKKIFRFNSNNNKCDFTGILHITEIKELEFVNQNFKDVPTLKFLYIDTINFLNIRKCSNLFLIDNILPNLKSIKSYLQLRENSDLDNIKIFNDFSIMDLPTWIPSGADVVYYPGKINIIDNPLLYHCDIDFICRALATYPDSVLISNNSPDCNKDDLLRQCTSATKEVGPIPDIRLYPNPSSGTIHLVAPIGMSRVRVTNMTGNLIYQAADFRDEINVSSWPPGVYLMTITLNDGTRTVKKLIRNE